MTRDELITRGMPLVRRMAHAMVRRCRAAVDVRDLIGAGHEGLLRAADAYDQNVGPFEPYAMTRIRGAMLDELRALDWLTRHARTRVNHITWAIHALRHRLGRAPTDEEIAVHIGHDETTVMGAKGSTVAQFRQASAHPKRTNPTLLATDYPLPDEVLMAREERARLAAAIAVLPGRVQRVLDLYFEGERTQLEIAHELGVTESRVCQVLAEAAARLRRLIDPGAPPPRKHCHNDKGRTASPTSRALRVQMREAAE